jgi:hypothetical protein
VFSWECLTEIVLVLGHHILEKHDENAEGTPAQFAKLLGFDKYYKQWLDSILTGHKVDWRNVYTEEERKTVVMFHGKNNCIIEFCDFIIALTVTPKN